MWLMVYSIVLLSSPSAISAARILGIFPLPAKSHFYFSHAIMRSLHDAGHRITMITPFPQSEKPNFTYIDSSFESLKYVSRITMDEITDVTLGFIFDVTRTTAKEYCYNVMKLPEIQAILSSPEKLYDIMFLEIWFEHECYLPIAKKLAIPVVGTAALHTWKWADALVGNPRNPAVVPEFFNRKLDMDLKARIENLWRFFAMDYYYYTNLREMFEQFHRDHFTNNILREKKEISLILYDNFPSLLSRPLVPTTIEIGGIQVETANPLPPDLQKFIDEAPHGVILFTLGSVMKVSSMTLEQKNAFLTAFASIPQRVIWKYEDPIENLPRNIFISSWIPQRDILEHKNVIAFISHCGQGGVYEAVWTGTPVITVPLFADQHVNAEILQSRGVGVGLNIETVTKEEVVAALDSIINDTSYHERMQTFSLIFKDRPMTPQQLVVYWTEYVIRYNGTRHLKAIGSDMPLYKYLMLDIVALGIITTSILIVFIFMVVRRICVRRETARVNHVKKRE